MYKRIKKIITVLIALTIITLSVAIAEVDTSTSNMMGDVDGDGEITSADALCILHYTVGKIDEFPAENTPSYTSGLEYYPLPDGTYGVAVGNAKYLEEIIIPSTYNGKTVTTIVENGFEGLQSLKTITIPHSITTIEKYAFNNCTVLETADIPDMVSTIGAYAFSNCSSLIKITIPPKLTVVEEYAFYGCQGAVANSIVIPKSVTKIMPHSLEISNDIGIYFEEGGTWNLKAPKTYSDRYGESTYTGSGKSVTFSVNKNYSNYCYGTKLRHYVDSDSYYDRYFRTNECVWTKVE